MAWLTNWTYRKLLYINGTGIEQMSYQMKITVNYGGGSDTTGNIYCNNLCKSDFSDIRFTDSSGNTLLNYWIETPLPSSSITVWVKIPDIPIGNNSTYIYLYYGYSSAISQSNGANTFITFYDLRNLSSLPSGWQSSGTVNFYSNGISVNAWGYALTTATFGNGNQMLDAYIVMPSSATGTSHYSIGFSNTGQYAVTGAYQTVHAEYGGGECTNHSTYGYFENDIGGSYSNCLVQGLAYGSSGVASIRYSGATSWFYINYSQVGSTTSNVPNIALNIGINNNQYAGTVNTPGILSWIRIRNYTSPEPTWSSNITTQATLNITSTPTGAEVWLRTPSGSGSYIDQGTMTNTTIGVTPGNYDVQLTIGANYQYFLNQTFNAVYVYNLQTTFPGQLSISSTPSNAEIWLGGVDRGVKTNNIISGLNPSPPDYNITLKFLNYQDWTGMTSVYANLTTTVIATFAGSANITSTPSGASIYLDGSLTSIGTTPLVITGLTSNTSDGTQPTQSHTYILKLTGYADTSGSFIATAGQTTNVPVTFPGSLYISSLPEDAQIYIDGVLQ